MVPRYVSFFIPKVDLAAVAATVGTIELDSVSATAFTGSTGNAFVSATGSFAGNGTVNRTATAVTADGVAISYTLVLPGND